MSLPRRAFLGAHLGPDAAAFSGDGMLIESVVDGAMAAAAGVRGGDRIERIAGLGVCSLRELGDALRAAGGERSVTIEYARGDSSLSSAVAVQACPREQLDGQRIDYGQVDSRGARLRTILSRPLDGQALGSVVVIQGIACDTVDFGPAADTPMAQLVHQWARAGYATLRVDKPGIGDSEGGPCCDIDFDTEVAAHRIALATLLGADRLPPPLYLFGHSIGGMIAALLAGEHAVAGVIVYGTSTMKWLDCIEATTRRQLQMRGASAEHIARRLSSLREEARTTGLNGRSATFHAQLDAIDLEAAWRRAQLTRVLVARGEHDWVVSPAEQARVADLAGESGASAAVIDLPGLDHVMGWHPDRAHSMSAYGAGRSDPALGERTLAWMVSSGA